MTLPATSNQKPETKKLVLFDIDGTLILAGGAGGRALNRSFERLYGKNGQWLDFCPHGMTDYFIIRKIFLEKLNHNPSDEEMEQIKAGYARYLPEELKKSDNYKILPYVKEVLDELNKRDDVVMGLVTGNFEKTGFLKLAHGDLDHYFDFGGFGEDGEDRLDMTRMAVKKGKDFIGYEPDDVYVIGDTVNDVRCGLGVGAKMIAVATGPVGVDELKEAGAHWAVKDLRSCLDII